ncbi:type B 50S ribosomal protein L31 [Candidatus Kaiserbacteria bacterium]|nr:type B 50S ribosomal protein L31 [Candidatus Kaiserbacteria bacterium]
MKKDIHPKEYRPVIFEDSSSGKRFLIASTVTTLKSDKMNGKQYPLYTVEISSASHPFYTGKATIVDTAGRVERFRKRAAAAKPKRVKK